MAKMDLDDAKTGSGKERAPNVGDLVDVYKFPEKKWVTLRLMPGLFSKASYWVVTKKRDGSKGKFNTACPSYDPQAQERDSTIADPWRDMAATLRDSMSEEDRKKRDAMLIQFTQEWYMQAIVRSIQKSLPDRMPKPTPSERKSGFKEKDSDSVTAFRAVRMGKSLLSKLQELKGLNTVESKTGAVKAFSVNDLKFGRDIRVYFDGSKAPADQYQVQLGDKRTPITEEEQAMLGWDLESACAPVTEGMDEEALEKYHKQVQDDFNQWVTKMGVKVKKSRRDVDDDEDFDSDTDEDEKPKRGKATNKSSQKRKPADDDFDDDDDGEEADDDFDDEPKRKPVKGKSAKGKKPVDDDDFDDDDDDGEEDDLDDDFDDEPKKKPATKGKAATGKGKKPIDDDDFDDDDGDSDADDDFDDEPKKKKPAAKAARGKKKIDDDFDDDDDLDTDDGESDDDDDFDDDDEPPVKKKPATKKAPPAKGKRKPAVEDDDDFDD